MKSALPLLATLLATFGGISHSVANTAANTTADTTLQTLQTRWAECQYQTLTMNREKCLTTLTEQAKADVKKYPERTDLLIWSAIIESSLAGERGGLGALDLVKEAKASLEKALKQNPNALDGSAYTSLGSLYYKVPGWPVGFGDDEQAERLLKKALAINPNGIDPNYFYGDFLLEQGDKAQAKVYLQKALQAPNRPGRELADKGRRYEIQQKLDKL